MIDWIIFISTHVVWGHVLKKKSLQILCCISYLQNWVNSTKTLISVGPNQILSSSINLTTYHCMVTTSRRCSKKQENLVHNSNNINAMKILNHFIIYYVCVEITITEQQFKRTSWLLKGGKKVLCPQIQFKNPTWHCCVTVLQVALREFSLVVCCNTRMKFNERLATWASVFLSTNWKEHTYKIQKTIVSSSRGDMFKT